MCEFNATDKLRRRRLIAQDLTISLERAGMLINEIDQSRWHHQESTGCTCWLEAIAKHKIPVQLANLPATSVPSVDEECA